MWEALLSQLIQNAIVPEIAAYIKSRFETTGEWPTEDELRLKVSTLAEDIKREGLAFLHRPTPIPTPQVHINKADNSD